MNGRCCRKDLNNCPYREIYLPQAAKERIEASKRLNEDFSLEDINNAIKENKKIRCLSIPCFYALEISIRGV